MILPPGVCLAHIKWILVGRRSTWARHPPTPLGGVTYHRFCLCHPPNKQSSCPPSCLPSKPFCPPFCPFTISPLAHSSVQSTPILLPTLLFLYSYLKVSILPQPLDNLHPFKSNLGTTTYYPHIRPFISPHAHHPTRPSAKNPFPILQHPCLPNPSTHPPRPPHPSAHASNHVHAHVLTVL